MSKHSLIATAAFGLEAVVARELKQLGYEQQTVADGKVTFEADLPAICRTNLWLRSADRVLLQVGQFEARDFGTLFDETFALPWADWIPPEGRFPVDGRSVRSQLHSVPDCQRIVKKAIAKKLKHSYGREWFDETGPLYSVEVALLKDQVTLSIDSSGAGLHKRGYRTHTGTAPLRETLAAALIQLSYWNRERAFLDPFCGSGTIPIEAALIGRNLAPGLARTFAAEAWPQLADHFWTEARNEARDLARADLPETLVATDADPKALNLARQHAQQAGVAANIHFQQRDFAQLTTSRKYGCLICNPPYGERMGDVQAAEALYRAMPRIFAPLDTWSLYVLTSHSQFEQLFGRRADRRRKLYNGRIECTYYQYPGPRPPRHETPSVAAPEQEAPRPGEPPG